MRRHRHAVLTAIAVLLAAGPGRSRATEEAAALPAALAAESMPAMPHAIWRLDPAIRDFVGPSDYAWDFNSPPAAAPTAPQLAALAPRPQAARQAAP